MTPGEDYWVIVMTTEFESIVRQKVKDKGGWFNAHAHLCRTATMNREYFKHAAMDPWDVATYELPIKQHTTGALHSSSAYQEESIKNRIQEKLEEMIQLGYRRVDSFIDVTPDIGLRAMNIAKELKEEYKDRLEIKLGAYAVFGFYSDRKEYWETFVEGAKLADFMGTLPERDMRDGHIGLKESIRRTLILSKELKKPLHVHLDQTRRPDEALTELFLEAKRWLKPDPDGFDNNQEPTDWVVHCLAPTSYPEERFRNLLERFKETNTGLIACPMATAGNRQERDILVPMYNSIPRILDFLLDRIPVRLGTDNIDDFYIPEGDADMFSQILFASVLLRCPSPRVWSKISTGSPLDEMDRKYIRETQR